MEKITLGLLMRTVCGIGFVALAGCTSMKTPATADVAVTKEAVANAADAGAAQYAPLELKSAQDKLAAANNAMAAKNYELARDLATQAQADAELAQSMAGSAKATAAADAVQEDVRVMREELDRSATQ
ncbi:MAG: DUF4398 domain-containing protein [Georgfuchsia sp.]